MGALSPHSSLRKGRGAPWIQTAFNPDRGSFLRHCPEVMCRQD